MRSDPYLTFKWVMRSDPDLNLKKSGGWVERLSGCVGWGGGCGGVVVVVGGGGG